MPIKPDIWTYADLIGHALDYIGGAGDATNERYARRSVQAAYNELMSKRTWTFFNQLGHINTVASYDTGTIEYTHATKTVTLTGGTFPTWAADGMLVIDNIPYPIVSRTSGTAVVLADANNPGEDVAAGAEFTIYKEAYTLPVDFGAMCSLYRLEGSPVCLTYLTPDGFLSQQQFDITPSEPFFYTITSDPNRYGVLALRLRAAPNDVYQLGYVYRRRPRPMRITSYEEGTVTVTAASTSITGNGTAWTESLVGTIIRFAPQGGADIPTGIAGANPFWLERSIVGFVNATTLTLDSAPGENLTAVKYSASDPCDVESGAMITYLLREIELQMRLVKRMKPASEDESAAYKMAMLGAFEADNRRYERESASAGARLLPGMFLKYGNVLPDA